jgi:hypothetical protein
MVVHIGVSHWVWYNLCLNTVRKELRKWIDNIKWFVWDILRYYGLDKDSLG